MTGTVWESIDEPMLRWVASLPPSLEVPFLQLQIREPERLPYVADLDSRSAHASLLRLRSYALVDGHDSATTHYVVWSRLRVTADGWRVLGDWPDLDRVASAATIHRLLQTLADDAPEPEREALIRASGVAARTGDEVLRDTIADVAKSIGEEAAGG